MPTPYGTLTPEDIKNGWTAASLAAYQAERDAAAGFVDQRGVVSLRAAGNTVTEYTRAPPPIQMESAMKFNPHKWGRR